ncbi:MAG TPA: aminotransferase class I/II-fold pyridoxal phosphate-dependent enzyme [Thermomicrobiales bacterium]|nr:aminotransferase class I/II-fold pyridoxal phosphate-dependent enzyme [Thermomicrobiales bacterium]
MASRDHRHSGIQTRAIHAGEALDPAPGAHGVPLYQNTTYGFHSYEQIEAWEAGAPHFMYARDGSPTVRCLELKVAELEGAEAAVGTATGMAAISGTLLHLVPAGGHLAASNHIYSISHRLLCTDLERYGASVTFVDSTDPEAVAAAIRPETRAVYVETFSNPGLLVSDLDALSTITRPRGIPLVVDNTFLSPALLQPLRHGADIVLHSATKYLSGHGNVVAGIISGRREVISAIAGTLSRLGGTMSPFSAWLLLSGIKTLPLRIERQSANALRLAQLLAAHPAVASVSYPGLPDHPQHAIAQRLVEDRGYGGMLSFSLAGGDDASRGFLNALELPTIAVSLGDVGTLIWPFRHSEVIRLSVGIEDIADLETDFTAALDGIGG